MFENIGINYLFTLENSKKLMFNVSTIPWISKELF